VRWNRPSVPAVLLPAAVAGVAAVLAVDAGTWGDREARAGDFQRIVGGLGLGPAADPSACAFSFDPRLSPRCPHESGPVPGGTCFCPYHGCSVLSYPPLEREAGLPPAGHGALP